MEHLRELYYWLEQDETMALVTQGFRDDILVSIEGEWHEGFSKRDAQMLRSVLAKKCDNLRRDLGEVERLFAILDYSGYDALLSHLRHEG